MSVKYRISNAPHFELFLYQTSRHDYSKGYGSLNNLTYLRIYVKVPLNVKVFEDIYDWVYEDPETGRPSDRPYKKLVKAGVPFGSIRNPNQKLLLAKGGDGGCFASDYKYGKGEVRRFTIKTEF